jgi:hypothetical protein
VYQIDIHISTKNGQRALGGLKWRVGGVEWSRERRVALLPGCTAVGKPGLTTRAVRGKIGHLFAKFLWQVPISFAYKEHLWYNIGRHRSLRMAFLEYAAIRFERLLAVMPGHLSSRGQASSPKASREF